MPRASERFKTEASGSSVEPVYLVQLVNIKSISPNYNDDCLYLTDSKTPVMWFDEDGIEVEYAPCGLRYENNEVSSNNSISSSKLSLDNVTRKFSALAQYYDLNGTLVNVYRGFRELLPYRDGAQLLMAGKLKKVIINETSIEAEVWTDFSLATQVPRRLYSVNDFPYLPKSKNVREIYTG